MKARQCMPEQWLIIAHSPDEPIWAALRRLPLRSGVLVLCPLSPAERRRLRNIATAKWLLVITGDETARVHNIRELRKALLSRKSLVLLSPLYPTQSHPDWAPLPRMRAAALARLGKRQLVALGGMNAERYARIARLGFIGWAGISTFRT